jgi:3-isopropylmalate/(R)-2-methylmalate dehydratase small subunit
MSLKPFTVVSGPAPYLSAPNIDTDVMIRIERLTALDRNDLGAYAFEAIRYLADGRENLDFVMNHVAFRGAPILLAGENFGCGSSREGAVWALQGMGVSCVIAPSFGDIFYSNCFQNGMLPIRLPAAEIDAIAKACANGSPLTIDLQHLKIVTPSGLQLTFLVDPVRREGLLNGLDDIGLTLKDDALVREWQCQDRRRRPWAWPATISV